MESTLNVALTRPLEQPGLGASPANAGVGRNLCAWLDRHLAPLESAEAVQVAFDDLLAAGLGEVPLPASGQTLVRWNVLAAIASRSLPLVKLYEAHLDARAILHELNAAPPEPNSRWGVFAAENPQAPLVASPTRFPNEVVLNGVKEWCSGAVFLTHALVTARRGQGESVLVAVDLSEKGIRIDETGWHAVGMKLSQTSRLEFSETRAIVVGRDDAYVKRVGFWHGALGIAACWFGASAFLAHAVEDALRRRPEAHGLAHLGSILTGLAGSRETLRAAASALDRAPQSDSQFLALSTRAAVEAACHSILDHAGRALGAAPFCRDARFAACAADLPVFLRQSHAEKDLECLGKQALDRHEDWISL